MVKWRVAKVKPGVWNATSPEGISANRRTWRFAMDFMDETERKSMRDLETSPGAISD